MRNSRAHVIRAGIGLTALSALLLAGCSSASDTAEFSDDTESAAAESSEQAAPEEDAPQYDHRVESGFFAADVSKDLTTSDTIRPEKGDVTTPNGTLEVKQIEALDDIKAATGDLEAVFDEETGEEIPYGPAEGDVFRIFDLSYVPGGELFDESDRPGTDLSLLINGKQIHLAELSTQSQARYLVSVPADGSAKFVVSSDGHDQFIDLLTGEREDDPIADVYYRDVIRQEPHHKFQIPTTKLGATYSDQTGTADISYDFRLASAELTPWQPDEGWAEEGRAWLALDWEYAVDNGTSDGFYGLLDVDQFTGNMVVEVGDESSELTQTAQRESLNFHGKDLRGYISVPSDTTKAFVHADGTVTLKPREMSQTKLTGDETARFTSDKFALDFPDANLAEAEAETPADTPSEAPDGDDSES